MAKAGSRRRRENGEAPVDAGAVPAETVGADFPAIDLVVRPPFPPMEALATEELPAGEGWLYEPKWDGFRCLVFRRGGDVLLQSKSGQTLGRYFPELIESVRSLPDERFVLDGEIAIFTEGALDFDALLQRIHPAQSRIRKLAAETPTTYLVFDLLVDAQGASLVESTLATRRARLEEFCARLPADGRVRLSPATRERTVAERWMRDLGAGGLDGVVAKRLDATYRSGERTAMRKVKRLRTADCVVGGFRYAQEGGAIGSLLLGLYDEDGLLDHVGFSSSFTATERAALKPIVEPLIEPPGFTGDAPGGPTSASRRLVSALRSSLAKAEVKPT